MSWRPCWFFSLLVLLAVSSVLSGATLTVGGGDKGNYTTIQSAVDRASAGDVVVVNPGTYTGTGNRDIDLKGKAITIQGSAPEDPNIVATTIVDCQGSATALHRGFSVVGCTGARIVGLTITNGVAAGGGAIFCASSVLDVVNCRILNNSTPAGDSALAMHGGCGGGIHAEDSSLQIIDCLISGNSTGNGVEGDGGGIYAGGTMVEMDGCTISNNHTGNGANSAATAGRGGDGGGVYADSLRVSDSNFAGNTTGHGGAGVQGGRGGNGGAIVCSRGTIARTTIEGNVAGSGGTSSGSGKVTAGAGGAGGGVYCRDSLQITDCLVAGNGSGRAGLLGAMVAPSLDGVGAGIWCAAGTIDHCTIVSNNVLRSVSTTAVIGGGLFCTRQTIVSNSILWDNTPDQLAGQDCSQVTFCDIQGGACTNGAGNIALSPGFTLPGAWVPVGELTIQSSWTDRSTVWASGDYQLSKTSPCIDAGDPDYTADVNAVDLAGRPRIGDGRVDIGAYEFTSLVPVYHFQSPKTNKHFYTAKEAEKNKLIVKSASDWTYKGVVYYAYARAVEPRLKPVYRLWSVKLGGHFWTSSETEKAKLMSGVAGGWVDEGVAFYAFAEDPRPAATKPVYRFWMTAINGHYFTIDEAEKDLLSAEGPGTIFEGPVWYAYDTLPAKEEEPVVTSHTYSFMADADAAVYQVTLKAVVDGEEVRLDNPTVLFKPALGHMVADVDLDALTFKLNSLFLESEFLQHSATATQSSGTTTLSHAFALSVYGFFNTATPRGPYAIDPGKLAFPQNQAAAQSGSGEDFVIAGAVSIDGAKADINSTLEATGLAMQGVAVLDTTNSPSALVMTMNGPFQWSRQGHESLLADMTVREHRIQLYVTSLMVQTTGVWTGKLADTGTQIKK
jgi:hypothetical protein